MAKEVEIGDYIYDKSYSIGRGEFGTVYDCRHKDKPDLKLCIKVIYEGYRQIIEQKVDDPKIQREMNLMKSLITANQGNPNIVKVEYVEMQNDKIYIVLERCDGDLQQLMNEKKTKGEKFTPEQALDIIKQIINGYRILFVNFIIHRDIKPANILYIGNVYKIADFGLARIIDNQQRDLTKVGSLAYAAPQLFHESTYTNSADIYSVLISLIQLGLMFYQLIFGTLPYKTSKNIEVRKGTRDIKTKPIKLELNNLELKKNNKVHKKIAELIESMLKYSEKERINWGGLFQHKLIKSEEEIIKNESGLLSIIEKTEEDEEQPQKNDQQLHEQQQTQTTFHQRQYSQPLQNQQFGNTQTQFKPIQQIPFQPSSVAQGFKPIVQPQPVSQQPPVPIITQPLLIKNPIIIILTLQSLPIISDQLYNVGVFHQCTYVLLDKLTTLSTPISSEIMGIKLCLYYLASSFFELSKTSKSQPQNKGSIPQKQVDDEISKQNQVKQFSEQEIRLNNLAHIYQIQPVQLQYQDYYNKLLQFYQQSKQQLVLSNDRNYFFEYLQLLFILEKFEESQQKILAANSIQAVCKCIQDIRKDISTDQIVKAYLQSRRKC